MIPAKLKQLRRTIDQLDQQLVRIVRQRTRLAKQVAVIKKTYGFPITDSQREAEIMRKISHVAASPALQNLLGNFFRQLMQVNKQVQLQQVGVMRTPVSIGIIGYGRFGKLLAHILQTYWHGTTLKIYSPECKIDKRQFYSLQETVQTDLLILCVPISQLQNVLLQIRPLLAPQTVVIDVCSVKVKPAQWMKKILGQQPMIASHPMFGPDSTKNGTEFMDLNLMLYNISAPKKIYRLYKSFWEQLGVNIVEITPAEHDRYGAYTINYNHLLGRVGELVGIRPTPVDTKGFQVIYDALEYVTRDTWQLFSDMQKLNPYAKEMRRKVLRSLLTLEKKLGKRSKE